MRRLFVLPAIFLLGIPGFAAAQQMVMQNGNSASSSADQDFSTGMTKMNNAMAASAMTGNADADFVGMMIPHHQGAVSMAETELKFGKDPQLRMMARDIIAAQDKEIAEMQHWQATHRP